LVAVRPDHDRTAVGVLTATLGGSRQVDDLPLVEARDDLDRLDDRTSQRERAGLVEDDRIHAPGRLQGCRVAHENAGLGGAPVARIRSVPDPLSVAPITVSPECFSTGTGSPVSIDSSTADDPSITTPSTGIRSPGRTRSTSPARTCSSGTSASR